jgi:hypothetical protein
MHPKVREATRTRTCAHLASITGACMGARASATTCVFTHV